MHKKWVIKGYDQSVTCLADVPHTLETPNNMLRTLGILSQTNNNIHKHSSNRCKDKTQKKRSKSKVQVKSFNMQKESIESELRNSNCGQKKFKFKTACNPNFNLSKPSSSLLTRKRGSRQRFWRLFHSIWTSG